MSVQVGDPTQCCLPSGFASLPKGVSISPGDGYGTLLPLESLPLTFTFVPPLTGPYTFQLECRTPLTTHFSLPCTAMAVLPAVTISHNCIKVQKSHSLRPYYITAPASACMSVVRGSAVLGSAMPGYLLCLCVSAYASVSVRNAASVVKQLAATSTPWCMSASVCVSDTKMHALLTKQYAYSYGNVIDIKAAVFQLGSRNHARKSCQGDTHSKSWQQLAHTPVGLPPRQGHSACRLPCNAAPCLHSLSAGLIMLVLSMASKHIT